MAQFCLLLAAAYGLLAVMFGAIGRHAVAARLDARASARWDTAVMYQFHHVPALLVTGLVLLLGMHNGWLVTAGWLFALGVLLFSGSLYTLALTDMRRLGVLAPVGGLLLMGGWLTLFVGIAAHQA